MLRKLTDNIFLGPMPGTAGESVDRWTERLSEHHVTHVICLAPPEDVAELSPDYADWRENPVIRENGIWQEVELIDSPIPDYGVPKDVEAFWDLACRLWYQLLPDGAVVYVHCRAGIGRTGLFATALMMVSGMTHTKAATVVAAAGSAAETEPQRAVLRSGPPAGLVENYREFGQDWSLESKRATRDVLERLDPVAFLGFAAAGNKGCMLKHLDGSHGYVSFDDAQNGRWHVRNAESDEVVLQAGSPAEVTAAGWRAS
jgi:hypothetical protein